MADPILRAERDAAWEAEGKDNGWTLPEPAPWPLRLPVIRTIRAIWHSVWLGMHVDRWASVGIGAGIPQSYDLWILYAVSRGWH